MEGCQGPKTMTHRAFAWELIGTYGSKMCSNRMFWVSFFSSEILWISLGRIRGILAIFQVASCCCLLGARLWFEVVMKHGRGL